MPWGQVLYYLSCLSVDFFLVGADLDSVGLTLGVAVRVCCVESCSSAVCAGVCVAVWAGCAGSCASAGAGGFLCSLLSNHLVCRCWFHICLTSHYRV